jgi:hypothetical protein
MPKNRFANQFRFLITRKIALKIAVFENKTAKLRPKKPYGNEIEFFFTLIFLPNPAFHSVLSIAEKSSYFRRCQSTEHRKYSFESG